MTASDTRAPVAPIAAPSERVLRHALFDRLYHWLMAASVLTLMGTAFLPIVGIKFEWLSLHWMTGIVLAVLVLIHIVRAVIWQDWRAMVPDGADIRDGFRKIRAAYGNGPAPGKPGKYKIAQ